MKNLTLAIALMGLTLAPAYAADNPPRPAARPPMGMQGGGPMMGNMGTMQEQMQRIVQSNDPKQRQKLLEEHMRAMQEQMTLMNTMMGGMMGPGQGARGGAAMPMNQRMQMMEGRMDAMQQMMEQMLQHMDALQP